MADQPTIGEKPPLSPKDEIRELERRLEEKKRALANGNGAETPLPEKGILREVLREHIEALRTTPPEAPPSPPTPPPAMPATIAPLAPQLGDDGSAKIVRDAALQLLIQKALTGTIEQAVKSAEMQSPYLLDELHDHLVDEYYEKLLQLRKIKPE